MSDKLLSNPEDNYKTGYIKLYRSVMDHPLFKTKEPFSRLEAWIDILSQVNHKPAKIVIKNVIILINRGESLNSLDTWGSRWRWDKSKVRRFLNLLEEDSMIVTKSEQISTRLTVCNYEAYQTERNTDDTQVKRKRHAVDTQLTPNKNDKNVNNDKEDIYRAFAHLKLTNSDYQKLIDLGYLKNQITSIIDGIENYKKNTQYTSLYLTAKKWLEKEYPKHEIQSEVDFLNQL